MESLWNLARRGFKHLRRKITKILSHCRALKSQSVGIVLQDFHRAVEAHDLSLVQREIFVNKLQLPFLILWSTHVNNAWLVQPLTSSVRWLVFKIQGFVRKRFLSSPPPPPLSYFGSRPNFARAKYRSGSVPWSFFATQPHRNACYAGYDNVWISDISISIYLNNFISSLVFVST